MEVKPPEKPLTEGAEYGRKFQIWNAEYYRGPIAEIQPRKECRKNYGTRKNNQIPG